jgi:hypothetical protein
MIFCFQSSLPFIQFLVAALYFLVVVPMRRPIVPISRATLIYVTTTVVLCSVPRYALLSVFYSSLTRPYFHCSVFKKIRDSKPRA